MPNPIDALTQIHRESYSDMPMGEFLQKYHAKNYSDIPWGEFTDKIGLTAPDSATKGMTVNATRKADGFIPSPRAKMIDTRTGKPTTQAEQESFDAGTPDYKNALIATGIVGGAAVGHPFLGGSLAAAGADMMNLPGGEFKAPAPRESYELGGMAKEAAANLPASLQQAALGIPTFPYAVGKQIFEGAKEGGLSGAGDATIEAGKGLYDAVVTPLTAITGAEEGYNRLVEDPVGSALAYAAPYHYGKKAVPKAARGLAAAGDAILRVDPYSKASTNARVASAFAPEEGKPGVVGDATMGPLTAPDAPKGEGYGDSLAVRNARQAANAEQSKALLDRIGAGDMSASHSQMTGDLTAALTEQSLAARTPEFAQKLTENDANILGKATENLVGKVGSGEKTITDTRPDIVGENIIAEVEKAKEPVKKQMDALEKMVPLDYTMPVSNLTAAIQKALSDPTLPDQAKPYLAEAKKALMARAPGGTLSTGQAWGLKRTIDGIIADAERNQPDASPGLMGMKEGIKADFDAMGEKARTGKVVTHKGKQVNIDVLTDEYVANLQKIADNETSNVLDHKKINPVVTIDRGSGPAPNYSSIPPRGIAKDAWEREIRERYKQKTGQNAPTVPSPEGKAAADRLRARNEAIKAVLAEVEPGADVGAAFRAYNEFASKNYFDRFESGATADVTRKGGQASGLQTKAENIPTRFWGLTGAADLTRALGSRDAARTQMLPHATELLRKASVDGNGTMDIPSAMKWLYENKQVVDAYGMRGQMQNIIKGQLRGYIENRLSLKGTENIKGDTVLSLDKSKKMVDEMVPILRRLGYDAETVNAFRDYHATVQMLSRNKNISYSKGSNTAEKIAAMKDVDALMNKLQSVYGVTVPDGTPKAAGNLAKNLSNAVTVFLSGGGAGLGSTHGGGSPGAVAGAIIGGAIGGIAEAKMLDRQASARRLFAQTITDALFDPALAKRLMDVGRNPTPKAKSAIAGDLAKAWGTVRDDAKRRLSDERGMVGKDINATGTMAHGGGVDLYHRTFDKNMKFPDFDAYLGDKNFSEAFKEDFGPYEHKVTVPAGINDRILNLEDGSKISGNVIRDIIDAAFPKGEDNADFAKLVMDGEKEAMQDFYGIWTDKDIVFPVIRKYGLPGMFYQGEWLLTKEAIKEARAAMESSPPLTVLAEQVRRPR